MGGSQKLFWLWGGILAHVCLLASSRDLLHGAEWPQGIWVSSAVMLTEHPGPPTTCLWVQMAHLGQPRSVLGYGNGARHGEIWPVP